MIRFAASILALSLLASTAQAEIPTDNPGTSTLDKAVQSAAETFFKDGCHIGLSVGLYDNGKTAFYDYGTVSKTAPGLPTPQSLYEIASITKTFTGALAAKAIIDHKMTLDGDFRVYLKEAYPNLEANGHPITLRTLATHTSGLPRDMPDSSALFSGQPDYDTLPFKLIAAAKDYDEARYLKELHAVTLSATPGTKMAYSNFGIKILSFGLEKVYGQSYAALLKRDITGPLGMTHTALEVADADKALLVEGYGPSGKPMPYHLLSDGAAGGLYSNASDMIKYAAWQVAETDPVVKLSHAPLNGDAKTYASGLIWDEGPAADGERKIWHSGGLYGMSSQLILFPDAGQAYVLLANDACFDTQGELHTMAMTIHTAQKTN